MPPPFHFTEFEHRRPLPPLKHSASREFLWQVLAVMNLVVGAWYLAWRWGDSIDYSSDGMWYSLWWFALPLVVAETCAYIGMVLVTFNLWKVEDTPQREPPREIGDCSAFAECYPARHLCVDVFFTTVDEDPELVRLSLRDAKRITYPHPIDIQIHVLDDGGRESMCRVAAEEGVDYITRENRIGFKAGNLANAMEQTGGDFILICDADTRPFPTILEHTLGYFRDPDVAWVQTPQWFYDLPEGRPLHEVWRHWLGRPGYGLARVIERLLGPIQLGYDPLINDPKMFYDVILRRRNGANAVFCCGAGSVHRRDALMQAAMKNYIDNVRNNSLKLERTEKKLNRMVQKLLAEHNIDNDAAELAGEIKKTTDRYFAKYIPVKPYEFHVSEDIYTSMTLHASQNFYTNRPWKSVLHPEVESKMLSPQDLGSWMVQRFKYAGGTLDIMLPLPDLPIFRSGFSWCQRLLGVPDMKPSRKMLFRRGFTLSQRLMYGATLWSYLGGIWNLIFLLGPIVYLLSAIAPVSAYTIDFYKHILPFLVLTELSFMVGTWGLSGFKGRASYVAFFSVNLRALWVVLKGRKIKFPVTPKQRREGNYGGLIIPQLVMAGLTLLAIPYGWMLHLNGMGRYTLAGLIINTFWGMHNIVALATMIRAAFWRPE